MEFGLAYTVERRQVFKVGIYTRSVIGLSIDHPGEGIANGFVLILWYVNVLCLIVDESEVKGEDAIAATIGQGVDAMGVGMVGITINPCEGGIAIVIANSDNVGLGKIHVAYFENQMYDAVAAMQGWDGYGVFVGTRHVVRDVETILSVDTWSVVTSAGMNGRISHMVQVDVDGLRD